MAHSGGSSFRRAASGRAAVLPGTRSWIHGQALTSCGLAALDSVLGGGLPLGTVVLVGEDGAGGHARTLAKCFVAEGVLCGHSTAVVGTMGRTHLSDLAAALPAEAGSHTATPAAGGDDAKAAEGETPEHSGATAGEDGLKIAWQYRKYLPEATGEGGSSDRLQAMPRHLAPSAKPVKSRSKRRLGHKLDLSKVMDDEILAANPVRVCDLGESDDGAAWRDVIECVRERVTAAGGCVGGEWGATKRLVRLAAVGLLGPLWPAPGRTASERARGAERCLLALRTIARRTRAVIFVTVPTGHQGDAAFMSRAEHLADMVVWLSDFKDVAAGTYDEHHAFKDFTGLLTVRKLSRLHTLACHPLDTLQYLFKRQRRRLTLEKLNLPPEDSRSSTAPPAPQPSGSGGADGRIGSASGSGSGRKHLHVGGSGSGKPNRTPRRATALEPGMSCASTGGRTNPLDF